jgi:hypothetical protein
MIINAHCLRGAKCNTCLRPQNPHWLWGINDYLHMGMKKLNYKEILNMKYPSKGIKPLFMVVYLMKLDAHSISNK